MHGEQVSNGHCTDAVSPQQPDAFLALRLNKKESGQKKAAPYFANLSMSSAATLILKGFDPPTKAISWNQFWLFNTL